MRFFIITKRHILLGTAVLIALVLTVATSAVSFAESERKLPIYCVECEEKKVAVSFDAAWGNDDTETLIKILKEYDVPATFFVVGAWVDKYPESVKALSDAGHQIQNHSNTHPYMTDLSKSQMINELESCNTKIQSITGVCPTLFRPPYGDYDNPTVETVESMGMHTIQWDVETLATKVIV